MKTCPIMSMAQITKLITDGKHGDCDEEEGSGYFFLSSKDLREGRLHYDKPRQITRAGFLETHRRTNLEPGDILLANCGASIGRVGIAQNDPRIYNTTFQKSISVIKANRELIDNKFLYYFITHKSALLIRLGNGAAQPNLLIGDLKRIEVPVPPLQMQQRIAGILSAYDELIDNNQQRIRVLEDMARSLYREWFVYFRYPGHEKHERIALTFGDLPEGWELRKIAEFADFVRGFEPGSNAYCKEPAPDRIKFLRVGDLSKRDSDTYISAELAEGKILEPSDIAITLDGSVGLVRVGYFGAYSTGIRKVVIRDESRLGWSFAYHLLLSDSVQATIQAHAKGTTIKHAGSAVSAIEFISPPPSIIRLFENATAPMLKQIKHLENQIYNLRRTRDLLLPRLLSGDTSIKERHIEI